MGRTRLDIVSQVGIEAGPLKMRSALLVTWLALVLTALPALSVVGQSFAEDEDYDSRDEEELDQHYDDEEQDQVYAEQEYEEEEYDEPPDFSYEDVVEQPTQISISPFDDSVTITEEEIVSLNTVGNDKVFLGSEIQPRVLEITDPVFGQAILNSDDTITYSPSQMPLPSGYQKTDIIRYTASADGATAYSGTVTIWIEQLNDSPVAYSANFTINENQKSTFYLGAFDEDNDALTYSALSTPEFGESELDPYSGRLVYTPLYEFSGRETLTFQVTDGQATSSIATVEITVLEVGGENSPIPGDDEDDYDDRDSSDEEDSDFEDMAPSATAGNDITVLTGDLASLDGSLSADPEGKPLSFSWMQRSGPGVRLEGADTHNPSFEAPLVRSVTTLTFELVVSDGFMADSTVVAVTVVPIDIDIMPDVNPNEIDLSEIYDEIPVAVIGGSYLDASSVSLSSLGFGPDSAPALRSELVDFNEDGHPDHISYYRTVDIGLVNGDRIACLTGSLQGSNGNDVPFSICKNVKVVL